MSDPEKSTGTTREGTQANPAVLPRRGCGTASQRSLPSSVQAETHLQRLLPAERSARALLGPVSLQEDQAGSRPDGPPGPPLLAPKAPQNLQTMWPTALKHIAKIPKLRKVLSFHFANHRAGWDLQQPPRLPHGAGHGVLLQGGHPVYTEGGRAEGRRGRPAPWPAHHVTPVPWSGWSVKLTTCPGDAHLHAGAGRGRLQPLHTHPARRASTQRLSRLPWLCRFHT